MQNNGLPKLFRFLFTIDRNRSVSSNYQDEVKSQDIGFERMIPPYGTWKSIVPNEMKETLLSMEQVRAICKIFLQNQNEIFDNFSSFF